MMNHVVACKDSDVASGKIGNKIEPGLASFCDNFWVCIN